MILIFSSFSIDFVSLITGFGLNGDDFDRATVWPGQSNIRIHCHAAKVSSRAIWYDNDGSPVGLTSRNLQQTFFPNGTTVLQIASDRLVSYCDAGVFTCVVSNEQGQTQRRNFTLLFNGIV